MKTGTGRNLMLADIAKIAEAMPITEKLARLGNGLEEIFPESHRLEAELKRQLGRVK